MFKRDLKALGTANIRLMPESDLRESQNRAKFFLVRNAQKKVFPTPVGMNRPPSSSSAQ
jgi:hypothetical protein